MAGKTTTKAQKTTTKGPFGQLQRFYPPALRCRNSSIAAITKNVTINAPFSGIFGFLQRVENRHHMRLEFVSIDFQRRVIPAAISVHLQWRAKGAAIGNQLKRINCSFSGGEKRRYMCKPFSSGQKHRHRASFKS